MTTHQVLIQTLCTGFMRDNNYRTLFNNFMSLIEFKFSSAFFSPMKKFAHRHFFICTLVHHFCQQSRPIDGTTQSLLTKPSPAGACCKFVVPVDWIKVSCSSVLLLLLAVELPSSNSGVLTPPGLLVGQVLKCQRSAPRPMNFAPQPQIRGSPMPCAPLKWSINVVFLVNFFAQKLQVCV